jgi:trigger factor
MNISVQKQPKCQAVLEVDIPQDVVAEEREQLVDGFMKQAKLPGYRPGKVPRKVIEKRFADSIREELDGRLMDKAFREALKQDDDLKVIDVKWPDKLTHNDGGDVHLKADLILAPDFELPEYKGIELKIPKIEVTDKLVDNEIDNLRQRNANYSEVSGRALQEDDLAVIDYTATCEGQDIEEVAGQPVGQLSKGEDYWIRIDEDSFLPGFATQLVGLNVNETRTVTVSLQEDFPLESLRGKDLAFEVTLKDIKEQDLPDDDTLVQTLMPGGSMEDIRETIESQLRFQVERQTQQVKETTLLDNIANSVEFDLPEEYVASETQGQADRLVEGAMKDGMSEEELQAEQEKIFQQAGERARNNLKVQFLLSEIAAAEKMQVPDAELLQHLTEMAKREKKPLKGYIKELQRERRIDSIRNQLLIAKTIDFLLEEANVVEVEQNENDSTNDE